ncbi:histamine H2 receptor isoform X3 [Scyliorhinus canicula]|uniref:histamine H2 receptor isoform X3 n=1 Tax=Scyliorhinus canicula TaxID=7830 RepID=UPI0018F34F1D|nr:histamine H2 receptor isoform X3 [Scyliorhinus canicula]
MKMLSITVLYTCLMILTCVGSITANILLLFILGFNQKLQKDTSVLIFNLSICDLILGLLVIPVGVHNTLFDGAGYSRQDAWCQFFAFFYVLLQLASVHSMTCVTIDKFAEICLPLSYVQLFTRRRAWVTIFSVWIYCILNASLPFVGLGQYTYEEHRYICAPSFNSSLKAYCVVTIVIGIFLPIMIVCCLAIYVVQIARHQAIRGTFECNEQHCYSVPEKCYLKSTIILVSAAWDVGVAGYACIYCPSPIVLEKLAMSCPLEPLQSFCCGNMVLLGRKLQDLDPATKYSNMVSSPKGSISRICNFSLFSFTYSNCKDLERNV